MSADGAKLAIGGVIGVVLAPFIAVLRFLYDWRATRHWRLLAIAAPAILIGGLVVVGFTKARFATKSGAAAAYAKQAARAFKAEDHGRAEMLYRKASGYDPTNSELKYVRALVLDKMGRPADAFSVMQSIAQLEDEKADTYPPGHLWIARSLLTKHVEVDGNPLVRANAHLNAIIVEQPEHVEAHRLKMIIAINLKNIPTAIKHIAYIVDKYPELRILYATLLENNKQTEEARKEAARAGEYYAVRFPERLAEGKKPLTVQEWINWSSSARLQGNYRQAVEVLGRALSAVENKSRVSKALGEVFVEWTKALDRADHSNIHQQLQLLGNALRIAPNSRAVLTRIATLIGRDESTDGVAEDMLQDALIEGTAPAMVHFWLGTRAAASGDMNKAKIHLEQASILEPNMSFVLNNLAWVLAEQGPDQLETALEYANQAVKLQPYNPTLRETRGQIYIKLENWQAGIADLEEALRRMKGNANLHTSLAKAYEAIGQADLADRHRRKVQEIGSVKKQTPTEPSDQTEGA
ncbi:MAG: hypothetical protein AB8G99_13800 [Planctomycetaceae bacterium]